MFRGESLPVLTEGGVTTPVTISCYVPAAAVAVSGGKRVLFVVLTCCLRTYEKNIVLDAVVKTLCSVTSLSVICIYMT